MVSSLRPTHRETKGSVAAHFATLALGQELEPVVPSSCTCQKHLVRSALRPLLLDKHVPDGSPVGGMYQSANFVLREPSEVFIPEFGRLQVCLASQYSALDEKGLLAQSLKLDRSIFLFLRLLILILVPADGVTRNDPCVHIDAASLNDDSFGSLVYISRISHTL